MALLKTMKFGSLTVENAYCRVASWSCVAAGEGIVVRMQIEVYPTEKDWRAGEPRLCLLPEMTIVLDGDNDSRGEMYAALKKTPMFKDSKDA